MKRVRITAKNYRGFSDESPVRYEIGPEFTAIVGPNNSGKSTSALLFYELRHLFEFLGAPDVGGNLCRIFERDWAFNINYLGLTDHHEIFNDTNERPLSIDLEIVDPESPPDRAGNDALARVSLVSNRSQPSVWRFAAFSQNVPRKNLCGGATPNISRHPATVNLQSSQLDCTDFVQAMSTLSKARYYGAFRNAINEGSGTYFDLVVGTAFIDLWHRWKTRGVKQHMDRIEKVTEDIRRLFGFGKLEINAAPEIKTLIVKIDGKSYRLAELGAGIAQFIMVLGNAAIHTPSILLIDEPETNLHPSLQQDFLLSLGAYATDGVYFSTHSIGLARSLAQPIFSIQRVEGKSIVHQFEATPNYVEFVGELSFSTFKELGHDRILLVEGVNDVKVAQQLLRMVRKDHTTVVLHLGGDQLACAHRENELAELGRLSKNLFALVDSERAKVGDEPIGNRKDFAEICKRLKIDACVTERRAIENYFPDYAVKAAFGAKYGSLSPFDELKKSANPWPKDKNWRVARHMRLEDIKDTDVGAFLGRL